MLSKIKNLKAGTGFVVGLLVAMLLVPSVAVAAGLSFTGIEGTSKNKADVSPAGQLLTTTAKASAAFESGDAGQETGTWTTLAHPPSGSALVITSIEADVYLDPSPGAGNYVSFQVEAAGCPGLSPASYFHTINPATVGETDLTYNPGLVVPNGNALCAENGGSVASESAAVGYVVPASAVTSGPLHPARIAQQG